MFHRNRWRWHDLCGVPKRRHIQFRRRGITQKKEYDIHNTAKVWNQGRYTSFSAVCRPDLGTTQPPVQLLPESISSTVKLLKHDANRWPSSNATIKNVWSHTSIPQFASWSQRTHCFSIRTSNHWMLWDEINVYLLWQSYITRTHITCPIWQDGEFHSITASYVLLGCKYLLTAAVVYPCFRNCSKPEHLRSWPCSLTWTFTSSMTIIHSLIFVDVSVQYVFLSPWYVSTHIPTF